jgi:hypothetical protein
MVNAAMWRRGDFHICLGLVGGLDCGLGASLQRFAEERFAEEHGQMNRGQAWTIEQL